jgi:hypothetical protein
MNALTVLISPKTVRAVPAHVGPELKPIIVREKGVRCRPWPCGGRIRLEIYL